MTRSAVAFGSLCLLACSMLLYAQAPSTPPRTPAQSPWRFAGTQPCVGPEGGVLQCPPAARTIAVRAGRLFDSDSGQMLTRQVVIVNGERITDVGPESQVRIPPGVQVIDLGQATVVPGLIDMHSHIYNNRRPNMTSERSALIAINNAQADLQAGFTAMRDMGSHGNGYGDVDVRNAINWGDLDGPRLQVAGRGIAWGPKPAGPRRFGIDDLKAPRIVRWVVKSSELEAVSGRAARSNVTLGAVIPGSRRRPDGVVLSWRYTDPNTVAADGLVPFFIDWGASPHPALTAARGASLVQLRGQHPDPERVQRMLNQLELDLRINRGFPPAIIATIDSPHGRVELR